MFRSRGPRHSGPLRAHCECDRSPASLSFDLMRQYDHRWRRDSPATQGSEPAPPSTRKPRDHTRFFRGCRTKVPMWRFGHDDGKFSALRATSEVRPQRRPVSRQTSDYPHGRASGRTSRSSVTDPSARHQMPAKTHRLSDSKMSFFVQSHLPLSRSCTAWFDPTCLTRALKSIPSGEWRAMPSNTVASPWV